MYLHLLASLVTLAAAVPYANPTPSISAAGSDSCQTPGQLLCHSPQKWGLCTEAHTITWMATARGTSCVCSEGICSIVLSKDRPHGPEPSSTTSAPPAVTPSSTLPATSTATSSATPSVPDGEAKYTQFNGNGSPYDGWPTMDDWLSFEELFQANQPIGSTCETAFGVPNNSPNETAALHDALINQAKAAGAPEQFALAIVLQESLGCVFVDTTFGSVANPGLMQDHDGAASCSGQTTCSQATIESMLKQGLQGTSTGAGIKQCHAQAPSNDSAQSWYQAARIYNGGSLGPNGSLGADSAGTSCYASDIANRLIGWSKGPSGCTTAG